MAEPIKPVAPVMKTRMMKSSTYCRELHGDNRAETDLPLLDALVGLADLVEPVRFGHDAHLAARGERERLVKVFAAVLLTADDLDPPHQEVERRNRERLGLGAHEDEAAVRPKPPDRIGHRVHRVARAEDDVRPACSGQGCAVADHLVRAKVADETILVRRMRYRDGLEACRLGVLDGEVPEPADAHDGNTLARLWRRPAESRPDGVAGAEDRRR